MANQVSNQESSVTSLITGIFDDAQKLLKQQVALAKVEIKEEVGKAKKAAASMAIGMGVAFIGAILLAQMCVELLHWFFPEAQLWVCFGIVGLVITGIGIGLLYAGKETAEDIHVVPEQTVDTMKENVQWIKKQM